MAASGLVPGRGLTTVSGMQSQSGNELRSVLLFISNLGLGGAERQLVYLALGLRQRGWQVTIASLSPLVHEPFRVSLERAGIGMEVLQQSMNANLVVLARAFRAGWRLVRATKPDALVGFMPHGVLFARTLGRLLRVPRVITSLRSIRSTRRWHDRVMALTRSLDHALVANSRAAAAAQVGAGVTTVAKSIVIPNGLETEHHVIGAKSLVPEDDGVFTWLYVAVFRAEKGHATLLQALQILKGSRPLRLRLAGEGPELETIKELSCRLDLDDVVEFLGKRTDVPDLIRQADAFVLPSLWEGLPNALIEALAGGLPAVATNVGGSPEVIQEDVSGLLVPAGDPGALATAMLRVMEMDQISRAQMGRAGQDFVVSEFAMDRMVDSWNRLLGQSVDAGHPSVRHPADAGGQFA